MLGRLYDEAEEVHRRYAAGTGDELRADFSLADIGKERAAENPIRTANTVSFTRLTFKQRGHASNHFTLFPVTRLDLSDDGITIWRRARPWTFAWSNVAISIVKRKANKGFGRYSFAKYTQRRCTILAGGKRFVFDVSDQYPDFGQPRELIAELERHATVSWG
jgi:hypothetical protein